MESSGGGARRISLPELLSFTFGYNWQHLAKKPERYDRLQERDAREELRQAESKLSSLTEAAKHAAKVAEEASRSEEQALRQELAASQAAEKAVDAQTSLDQVRDASDQALGELGLQEASTRRKREALEGIASDHKQGIVRRHKARAELAILLGEDPLPLRTARIKLEVAVQKTTAAARNAENTVALSEAALARATHARQEALRLKEAAIVEAKRAEEAIPVAQSSFEKIHERLEEMIKKRSVGKGTAYFFQSDLNRSRKYLPKSRFVVTQKRKSAP